MILRQPILIGIAFLVQLRIKCLFCADGTKKSEEIPSLLVVTSNEFFAAIIPFFYRLTLRYSYHNFIRFKS